MPKPKQEISFSIETIEDMMFNERIYDFFNLLTTLINDGNWLSFYRHNEKLTTIKDAQHLENFKRSFKFIK
jgi:hypothetical protein